jgi:hypothetical protein
MQTRQSCPSGMILPASGGPSSTTLQNRP